MWHDAFVSQRLAQITDCHAFRSIEQISQFSNSVPSSVGLREWVDFARNTAFTDHDGRQLACQELAHLAWAFANLRVQDLLRREIAQDSWCVHFPIRHGFGRE